VLGIRNASLAVLSQGIRTSGNGAAAGGGVETNIGVPFTPGMEPVDRAAARHKTRVAAGLAMALALAVYCLGRGQPPLLLEPFHLSLSGATAWQGSLGSAPSLLYTLSLALILGALASTRAAATRHVLLWTVLAMALEYCQHPLLAQSVGGWLQQCLPDAAWQVTRAYWQRGTFDSLDLLATLSGGLLGLLMLNRFHGSVEHEYQD
jgi:hypothetical protein